jgi:hypothetical protein
VRYGKPVLIAAIGAVCVAGAVVLAFTVGRSHPHHTAAAASRPSPQASNAGPAVAKALQTLATNPQALVASGASGAVGADARSGVPTGTVITPHPASWQPNTTGGGTMVVDLKPPGGPMVSYLAVMVHEAGGWKVLGTIPVPAAATPSPPVATSSPAGTP